MSEKQGSFKQQLTLIMVDKLLIGLILVLIGLFANNLVEKLKSQREFSAELNKIRAQKTGEVWEGINLYEAKAQTISDELRASLIRAADEYAKANSRMNATAQKSAKVQTPQGALRKDVETITEASSQSSTSYRDVLILINKDRFWLGEDNFGTILKYLNTSEDYLGALREGDKETIKKQEEERAKLRMTINQLRDKLLKE